jgi:hypothetical protein
MSSDIVALSAVDAEALEQQLDALVVAPEAVEEKAAAACCRILAPPVSSLMRSGLPISNGRLPPPRS